MVVSFDFCFLENQLFIITSIYMHTLVCGPYCNEIAIFHLMELLQ